MPPQVTDTSWGFSPVLHALNSEYEDDQDGHLTFFTDGASDDRVHKDVSADGSQDTAASSLGDFSKIWGDLGVSEVSLGWSSSVSPATPSLEYLPPLDTNATVAPEATSDNDDVFSFPPLEFAMQHRLADEYELDMQQKFLPSEVLVVNPDSHNLPLSTGDPAMLYSSAAQGASLVTLDSKPSGSDDESPKKKKKKNKKAKKKAKKVSEDLDNVQPESELAAVGMSSSGVRKAALDTVPTVVHAPLQPSSPRECEPLSRSDSVHNSSEVRSKAVQILRRRTEAITNSQLEPRVPTTTLPQVNAVSSTPVEPVLAEHSSTPSDLQSKRGALTDILTTLTEQYRVRNSTPDSSYNRAASATSYNPAASHVYGSAGGYFGLPRVASSQPAHAQTTHVATSQATPPLLATPVPANSSSLIPVRSREDRHFDLLKKLMDLFPEDKRNLVSPMQLCNDGVGGGSVHVFVDASNILIGFKDKLKELRMPQLDLAFDCLALIMERRRGTGKRVLAGSSRASAPMPHIERFMATVKAVGYEHHIFELVQKRKEPTAGQKFFQDVRRVGWQEAQQRRSGEGSGSETDTGPSTPLPLKWVEQGVDEILHLRMLQSVTDVEQPGIMVLATGDGQQAEFSDGFPAHVERALSKGWKIELVSWKQQTSSVYRHKNFVKKWGDRFKILYLDDFVEYLVDN